LQLVVVVVALVMVTAFPDQVQRLMHQPIVRTVAETALVVLVEMVELEEP
jgi:hypothetical protein